MKKLLVPAIQLAFVAGCILFIALLFSSNQLTADVRGEAQEVELDTQPSTSPTEIRDWASLELGPPIPVGDPPSLINLHFVCEVFKTPLDNIVVTRVTETEDHQFVDGTTRESGKGQNNRWRNVVAVPSDWVFRVTIQGEDVEQIMSFKTGVSTNVVLSCGDTITELLAITNTPARSSGS